MGEATDLAQKSFEEALQELEEIVKSLEGGKGTLAQAIAESPAFSIAGGGDNTVYSAAPGARTEAAAPVARLVGGGDNAQVIYTAPAGAGALAGTLPGPSFGG